METMNSYSSVIPEISVQETAKLIDKLSVAKATGHDGINVKVLKLISPVFSQPLSTLFNLSIQMGSPINGK